MARSSSSARAKAVRTSESLTSDRMRQSTTAETRNSATLASVPTHASDRRGGAGGAAGLPPPASPAGRTSELSIIDPCETARPACRGRLLMAATADARKPGREKSGEAGGLLQGRPGEPDGLGRRADLVPCRAVDGHAVADPFGPDAPLRFAGDQHRGVAAGERR